MRKFLDIEARSKESAEMFLYGTIAQWNELNALTLNRKLRELAEKGYKEVTIHVHSPGGSMYEGLAMYAAIKNSPVKVNIKIDGMAASMASGIAMGADNVEMAEHGRIMIHQGQGGLVGSAKQIKSYGALLDSLNRSMAEIYSAKTGKEVDWILENWMAEGEDTWFTAKEALKAGLIDGIYKGKLKEEPKKAEWMEMAAFYAESLQEEETDTQPNQNNHHMDKKELIALLGLEEDATDEQIKAAIKKQKADKEKVSEDDLIDSLVELAESKGMDKEMVKLAAKADLKATLERVKNFKAQEKPADEGKGADKHESIADALKALADGKKSKEEEESLENYTVAELEEMKAKDNEKYEKLIKAKYGRSVSQLSATFK